MKTGLDLKIIRIKKGIKGTELSKMLEVSQSYISKMENGAKKIPQHIYDRWSKVLGVK